ncbi:hypothetical protein KKH36_00840 [Patescibacteria group bacterium]|nr:hypothetical protein [Patescibacteria group bacterium]
MENSKLKTEERLEEIKKMNSISVLGADLGWNRESMWVVVREDDPSYQNLAKKYPTEIEKVHTPENFFISESDLHEMEDIEYTAYSFEGPCFS